MMINIKKLLKNYSRLLDSSWDIIEQTSAKDLTGSFKNDWLQANWELLVEGMLGDSEKVLEIYGDGADCNGASSRILFPERMPTHKIVCMPIMGGGVHDALSRKELNLSKGDIAFDRFVTMGSDGWYYEKPKFDYVLADHNGKEVVLRFEELEFELKENVRSIVAT